jgi:hypothetical protein
MERRELREFFLGEGGDRGRLFRCLFFLSAQVWQLKDCTRGEFPVGVPLIIRNSPSIRPNDYIY